ncbi:hypothetical protein ACH44C_17095 [Streptomyces purpureus]|uniref:hypothetical protein n=1 Tax=Streptomyces purpureus TaxID=1951 RepID=UPI0037B3FC2C
MNTDPTTYFDELSTALRAAGVAEAQIASTVAELTGHLAETGTAPEEEFGPAAVFAAQLGGTAPAAGAPVAEAETWTWTADIYSDRHLLAVHGDEGWEVERLDTLGRFVCRRVPGSAMRWEYRRELISGRRRARVLAELEPEGWEMCGEWVLYAYFKRPKAASEGPAAELATLPAKPKGWLYLSTRGRWMLAAWATLLVFLGTAYLIGALHMPSYVAALIATSGAAAAAYGTKRDLVKGTDDGKTTAKAR